MGTTGASSKSRRAGSGYIIKERGYGDGNEYADLTYEKQIGMAIVKNGVPIEIETRNY